MTELLAYISALLEEAGSSGFLDTESEQRLTFYQMSQQSERTLPWKPDGAQPGNNAFVVRPFDYVFHEIIPGLNGKTAAGLA